jgi:hypothetical protein
MISVTDFPMFLFRIGVHFLHHCGIELFRVWLLHCLVVAHRVRVGSGFECEGYGIRLELLKGLVFLVKLWVDRLMCCDESDNPFTSLLHLNVPLHHLTVAARSTGVYGLRGHHGIPKGPYAVVQWDCLVVIYVTLDILRSSREASIPSCSVALRVGSTSCATNGEMFVSGGGISGVGGAVVVAIGVGPWKPHNFSAIGYLRLWVDAAARYRFEEVVVAKVELRRRVGRLEAQRPKTSDTDHA